MLSVTTLPQQAHQPNPHQALIQDICSQVARCGVQVYGDAALALVLTGSMARDESAFLREPDGWRASGDADFVLVQDRRASREPQARLRAEIARCLQAQHILCDVTISHATIADLQRMTPRIYSYELREMGRVVWGDSTALDRIPHFSPRDIPRNDAWELLCNRIIEYLDASLGAAAQGRRSTIATYRATKLVLDTATSLLVFAGEYVPSYRGRAEKISDLAASSFQLCGTSSLPKFAQLVRECTDIKLGRTTASTEFQTTIATQAMQHARELWLWESAQLTAGLQDAEWQSLLEQLAESQPLRQRTSAWLRFLRRRDFRDWRNALRWPRQFFAGSPRLLIYRAALELLFAECGSELPQRQIERARALALLPLRKDRVKGSTRERMARAVAFNYQRVLLG